MSRAADRVPLREADLARDQRRGRAGQGLHRPCGAVEQHGPHLPLDVDLVCPTGIALGAGALGPRQDARAADGGLRLHRPRDGLPRHDQQRLRALHAPVLDITKSLAYHGFKKIILLNGHGSNMPNLDLVARRTNLETDAECVRAVVEPADGGQGLPAALAPEQVPRRLRPRLRAGDVALPLSRRRQRAQGQDQERHDQLQRGGEPVQLGRLFAAGPATVISWTAATPRPACWARPSWPRRRRASAPTRRRSNSSSRFVTWFKDRPKDVRRDRHRRPPTMPMPWGQLSATTQDDEEAT